MVVSRITVPWLKSAADRREGVLVKAIASFDSVSTRWLTEILRREGVLDGAEVAAMKTETLPQLNSTTCRITPQYTAPMPQTAPRQLLLKVTSGWSSENEFRVYDFVRREPKPPAMLARCFDVAYDCAAGHCHVLLEDLSDTHETPARGVMPTEENLLRMVECIGLFHAHWWERPESSDGFARLPRPFQNQANYLNEVARFGANWQQFEESVGAELPDGLGDLYSLILDRLPSLWESYFGRRFGDRDRLTLTNGDSYFNQFLVPRGQGVTQSGRAYLVDFGCACTNIPADDLVYMFATFWTPEQRAEGGRERRLIDAYHQALVANGVTNYSLDQLHTDYRLKLIWRALLPIWDQCNGSSRSYWWPKMLCLAAAFKDWQCQALL